MIMHSNKKKKYVDIIYKYHNTLYSKTVRTYQYNEKISMDIENVNFPIKYSLYVPIAENF